MDDNATLYGKKPENRDIVNQGRTRTKGRRELTALLTRYSAEERG